MECSVCAQIFIQVLQAVSEKKLVIVLVLGTEFQIQLWPVQCSDMKAKTKLQICNLLQCFYLLNYKIWGMLQDQN